MKSKELKIVFLGTSEFAAPLLESLVHAGFNVVAVVTRPDRPMGRSLKVSPSPVKALTLSQLPHVSLFQPEKVSTPEFETILKNLKPDLLVVAAFGEIIKPPILAIPKLGSINVHPSCLPKYRGPAPLQAALLNGDKQTGVCIIDVADKMDAGVIFAERYLPIDPKDNFTTLQEKALSMAKPLLLGVIEQKAHGVTQGRVQDETQVVFCHKIKAEHEKIDWSKSLESIHHHIRALSETPGAWSYLQVGEEVKRVKIYATELYEQKDYPYPLDSKKQLHIQKEGFVLRIVELQMEGKKRMNATAFLSGIREGCQFK